MKSLAEEEAYGPQELVAGDFGTLEGVKRVEKNVLILVRGLDILVRKKFDYNKIGNKKRGQNTTPTIEIIFLLKQNLGGILYNNFVNGVM